MASTLGCLLPCLFLRSCGRCPLRGSAKIGLSFSPANEITICARSIILVGFPLAILNVSKYKGFRMGKVWVNYRKAFEEFVRHGAVPFKEEKIDYIVKKIANILTGCSLSERP